jgi:hypothetical protein
MYLLKTGPKWTLSRNLRKEFCPVSPLDALLVCMKWQQPAGGVHGIEVVGRRVDFHRGAKPGTLHLSFRRRRPP